MASSETSTVSPGVTRKEYGRVCYDYVGTKEALVRSGYAQDSWFVAVGERDRLGRSARSKQLEVDGRLIETRVPARGPAYVRFKYTADELAAMEPQFEAETARKAAREASRKIRRAEVQQQYEHYCPALAERLESRYPGVQILLVYVAPHGDGEDGEIQQTVEYRATRAVLMSSGLVTDRMFGVANDQRYSYAYFAGTTELGCGFSLHKSIDGKFAEGSWDLNVHTGELPRDGRRLTQRGLREVAKVLRKFSKER